MYRWHTFSYEWFGTKTRFARGKSQLFIHELLREPLILSFFPSLFKAILKPAELQHCVMSFLLHVFIINLLVISPCPYLPEFIYNIIAKTLTSNTHLGILDFVSSLGNL